MFAEPGSPSAIQVGGTALNPCAGGNYVLDVGKRSDPLTEARYLCDQGKTLCSRVRSVSIPGKSSCHAHTPARRMYRRNRIRSVHSRQLFAAAFRPFGSLALPRLIGRYLNENPACTAVSVKSFASCWALVAACFSLNDRVPSDLRVHEFLLSFRKST